MLCRKLVSHEWMFPLMPYCSSLCRNLSCGTVSNALEKSRMAMSTCPLSCSCRKSLIVVISWVSQEYPVLNPNIHSWLTNFLSTRAMRTIVEGESSKETSVDSWVPQGTVLGPIMFLCHINDLPDCVNSSVRLFADDDQLGFARISGPETMV
jgi:hypothetical protein